MLNTGPAARLETSPFLSLANIRKSYPGVVALSGFSADVSPGEVIGLIGENGAGKSTLMKVLGGIIAPDSGSITIDGVSHDALSVENSISAGIAFVHQELSLFENLDVAANVFIGREPSRFGWLKIIDREKQRSMVTPFLARIGANFAPDAPLANLSLAQRQMVEIAKALAMRARLVIFDEPTSSLPLSETEKLLAIIAGLKADGMSVIFISHRLHEIERAADRVVALRDGKLVGSLERSEITHDRMVRLMIGRDLGAQTRTATSRPGKAVLKARNVRTHAYPQRSVDIDLRPGEILGLAGLVGAGRTELACALFGVDKMLAGEIEFDGAPLKLGCAADAVSKGIFLVPEDRKAKGLLLDMPIVENITLPDLKAYSSRTIMSGRREARVAERQKSELDIRAPSVTVAAKSLSGGNQQKIVLAKWLAMHPRVMIFDEPTRGVDVGAKAEIYWLMRRLAGSGVAILMISSDMEEVIGVSDRIAVMCEGAIVGILDHKDFSEENVLLLAVGADIKTRTQS